MYTVFQIMWKDVLDAAKNKIAESEDTRKKCLLVLDVYVCFETRQKFGLSSILIFLRNIT